MSCGAAAQDRIDPEPGSTHLSAVSPPSTNKVSSSPRRERRSQPQTRHLLPPAGCNRETDLAHLRTSDIGGEPPRWSCGPSISGDDSRSMLTPASLLARMRSGQQDDGSEEVQQEESLKAASEKEKTLFFIRTLDVRKRRQLERRRRRGGAIKAP